VSYDTQSRLQNDPGFTNRCSACITQQSQVFVNDTRLDIQALAVAWLSGGWVGGVGLLNVWMPILAAEPGFADSVQNEDDTITSARIDDAQILSSVQAQYPGVAKLLFNEDGTAKG
jgi:hypothetical protein